LIKKHLAHRLLGLALAALGAFAGTPVSTAQAATWQALLITARDDPRHERLRQEKAYPGQPTGGVRAALDVALDESRANLEASGHQIKLDALEWDGASVPALVADINRRGAQHLLLDLPLAQQQALMAQFGQLKTRPIVFNLSEADDVLRASACHPNWLHTAPSQRMLADAWAQWLASRNWRDVLWLVGPRPADQALREVWAGALKRQGIKVKAERRFVLSGDPRQRDQANPRLLTAEPAHDAVLVLDTDGEFARTLPYATALPRPVLGSAGLVPLAWHPQWDRYGAPQLNRRFVKRANRPMTGQDWAAWVAMKAIVTVLEDKPQANLAQQLAALRSGEVVVDGFKGGTVSFRPWDGQLRQPIFLAHGDGVAAQAPVEGAMHPRDVLDTLGVDERESTCKNR
jgi:ABC transporter substrate binding protein (PQQ-dependent alcohol dehydrogenase system)